MSKQARARKWTLFVLVFWGGMAALWWCLFYLAPGFITGSMVVFTFLPFLVYVRRQLQDIPIPGIPTTSAPASSVEEGKTGGSSPLGFVATLIAIPVHLCGWWYVYETYIEDPAVAVAREAQYQERRQEAKRQEAKLQEEKRLEEERRTAERREAERRKPYELKSRGEGDAIYGCEKALKGALRSPSSYKEVSYNVRFRPVVEPWEQLVAFRADRAAHKAYVLAPLDYWKRLYEMKQSKAHWVMVDLNYDAQNGFGATIRGRVSCGLLDHDGDGQPDDLLWAVAG